MDCTPLLLMDHLLDTFMTASNTQFHNDVQNFKDFHCACVNNPEALFVQVQDYCDNIITKPGIVWLKMKKLRAAFTAGAPMQCQLVGLMPLQVSQTALVPAPSNQDNQSGGGNCVPPQVWIALNPRMVSHALV